MPDRHFAKVHILDVPYTADKPYYYGIPTELYGKVKVGDMAVVPFGNGNSFKLALITEISDKSEYDRVKYIYGLPLGEFSLKGDLVGLSLFMKDSLFCTVGEAVKSMLPTGVGVKSRPFYKSTGRSLPSRTLTEAEQGILNFITSDSPSLPEIKAKFGDGNEVVTAVKRLTGGKLCKTENELSFVINTKTESMISIALQNDELEKVLLPENRDYTVMQKDALRILSDLPPLRKSEIIECYGISASVISALIKKAALENTKVRIERNPYGTVNTEGEYLDPSKDIILSEEQTKAYNELLSLYKENDAKAALLFGVTGSGKTKVMQKLCDDCIADGKDAIILIPEIALTSQTVQIFTGRYGSRVSVLHSGLSAGERTDAWRKINTSSGNIVVGTRSAVFAPVKKLGMIVIDEEQESSFKSDMNPKYHARDIARYRCAASGALMLLSSATPSLESFKKASDGVYSLVKLTSRFGKATLPTVSICDLREKKKPETGVPSLIGEELTSELRKNVENGEQSVLFLNKRGYNAFISCKSCGYVVECPNCSVSMTYHKYGYGSGGRLVCHYCGYTAAVPQKCPACESEHIGYVGSGIQMLEEELTRVLPEARLLRMDLDTTSGKMAHDRLLNSFRNREADILIGTQMVAKGHDFGNVSLVGIVLADSSLYLGDYRASERTFSLITQVIGRAGRAQIPGRAVIQTYSPDNEVLQLAASQDYEAFCKGETALRKATGFPPYCDIVTVTFTSETESSVLSAAQAFGRDLDRFAKSDYSDVKMIVYGPFKAGIFKLVGKYRMRYIIKCRNSKRQRSLFSELYSKYLEESKGIVSISLDINPATML